MGNIMIAGADVWSDAATLSSASAISSSLPLSNLATAQLSKPCRSTNISGFHIVADLGVARAVNLVGVIGHNGTASATFRLRAADTEADLTASPDYDSGSVSIWTGVDLDTGAKSFRWWRIDIEDATNPDGYFDIGRLYIAQAWQPDINLAYGWRLGHIDNSPIDLSIGGQMLPLERPQRRYIEASLPFQSEAQLYENFYELQRQRGVTKDVLVVRDPGGTYREQQSIYGLMREPAPITNPFFDIFEAALRVEELVP